MSYLILHEDVKLWYDQKTNTIYTKKNETGKWSCIGDILLFSNRSLKFETVDNKVELRKYKDGSPCSTVKLQNKREGEEYLIGASCTVKTKNSKVLSYILGKHKRIEDCFGSHRDTEEAVNCIIEIPYIDLIEVRVRNRIFILRPSDK